MYQLVVDIPLSKAYGVTWSAMEKLVSQGKTKMIGKHPRHSMEELSTHSFKGYPTSQLQSLDD